MEEYTLYPIKKADVDWKLYHLVRRFLEKRCEINTGSSDGAYDFSLFDEYTKKEENDFAIYLVFPSEDLTVSYTEEMLEQDELVLKYYYLVEHFEQTIPGQTEPLDDDDVWYESLPVEYFCFPNGTNDNKLQYFKTDNLSSAPNCYYNGVEFSNALIRLIDFLEINQLTDISWYERLLMTKRMLDGEANELHILHNAGLYDHATLWSCLEECGIANDIVGRLRESYLSQLKIYAMFVLNRLDWKWGNTVGKDDREKRRYLFWPKSSLSDEIKKEEKEIERRKKIKRAKAYRQQKASATPDPEAAKELQAIMESLHKAAATWEAPAVEQHNTDDISDKRSNQHIIRAIVYTLICTLAFVCMFIILDYFS